MMTLTVEQVSCLLYLKQNDFCDKCCKVSNYFSLFFFFFLPEIYDNDSPHPGF